MLSKLRIRLTLICVITTGVLLTIVAAVLLFMASSQIDKQSELTFQNNVNSLVYRLQTSRTIDDSWLSQLESGNNLIVYIEDNTHPISFRGSWDPKTDRNILIDRVHETALSSYTFDVKKKPSSTIQTENVSFRIEGDHGDKYQTAVVSILSAYGWESLTMLRDLSVDNQQKMLFIISAFTIIIAGLILLLLFSLWFSKRAIEPIEASSRRTTEFIASASHELRSPLSVVKASLSAISISNHQGEDVKQHENSQPVGDINSENEERLTIKKYTDIANRECDRMSRLVDDLLLLASADAHTWSLYSEPISIDTLLIEVYENFEPLAREKEQSLSIILPRDFSFEIQGDKQRLAQAISVILDNATYYTPPGGHIEIEETINKNMISISIADTGIGISDSDKQRIFERFYRGSTARSEKDHYGLGLSVAKEIVELHGGKIFVTDTPSGGATFIIELYK